MRFPLMVLKRMRERIGRSGCDDPPPVRSGAGGYTVGDIINFQPGAGICRYRRDASDGLTNMMASTTGRWGSTWNSPRPSKVRQVNIPIFSIGSILHPEQAEEIIASGKADGVSMSRALIADPFWPKKAADGRSDEITPCLRCLNCTDSDNLDRHFVCSVNPYIGREARIGFTDTMGKANFRKKALVAGGGPAGMQAAITAAQRGHEVVLCERSDALGGLLRFTDTDSLKHDLRRYKEFRRRVYT